MAGETDTLPHGGTDNANLTSIDNPDNWNFSDPDEDQDTVEPATDGTDGEPVENSEEHPEDDQDSKDEQETDDQQDDEEDGESQDDDESEEGDEPPVKDDVTVTLSDGTQVELGELKKGYLRQADYTRKQQELGNSRNSLSEKTERIDRLFETFTDFLAKQIPDEPDMSLAHSDPSRYVQMKAHRDAVLGQIQELISVADQPKEVKNQLNEDDTRKTLLEENQKLADAMPMTANSKGREQFFNDVMTGAGELGFSADEIKGVSDHRLLMLGYWAQKGLAAEKAKAKAKTKVADAPPVAPQKRSKGGKDQVTKNRNAMRRLSQTGSINDALAVDFD